jgi:hypothetical protein
MQEQKIQVNAEIQVHWFCPECETGLTTFLDLGDTAKVINKVHDKLQGIKPCPKEWFLVKIQYPEVAVELYSS